VLGAPDRRRMDYNMNTKTNKATIFRGIVVDDRKGATITTVQADGNDDLPPPPPGAPEERRRLRQAETHELSLKGYEDTFVTKTMAYLQTG